MLGRWKSIVTVLAFADLIVARPALTPAAVGVATSAALDLYVDPVAGNDSNDCLSATTACLTPPAACNKIPIVVKYPVTVHHAAGTYSAGLCDIEGRVYMPADPTLGAWIQLDGPAMTTVTPASGSATGTLTSFTAAGNAAGTMPVVTVTAAGWTVSDFKGKFLIFTGGTCVGGVNTIYDNAATTITLTANTIFGNQLSASCTPDATTTFRVADVGGAAGATVTGQLTLAKAGPIDVLQPNTAAATVNTASVIVGGNGGIASASGFNSSFVSSTVFITRFLFSGAITPGFIANSQGVTFTQNRFSGTKSTNYRNSSGSVTYNVVTPQTAGTYFVKADAVERDSVAGRMTMASNTVITGALLNATAGQGAVILRANSVRGATVSAVSLKSVSGGFEDFHDFYETSTTCLSLGVGGNTALYGFGSAEIGDFYCTGFTSTGIAMVGQWYEGALTANAWTITGAAGSTVGVNIFGGAHMDLPAGSTVTVNNGTSSNALSLGAPHPEDYFSTTNLTNLGNKIQAPDGTCLSQGGQTSCYAQNVGPWFDYTSSNIGEGAMVKFSARPTANLPVSSTANGEVTTAGVFWDSTVGCLKVNDGTAWSCLLNADAPANFIFDAAIYTNNIANGVDLNAAEINRAATLKSLRFTTDVAGTNGGGTTIVFSLCNGPGACTTSFGSITVNCTAAAGTVTVGTVTTAAVPAATIANWRITTDGCTLDSLGNMSASLTTP